MEEVEIEEKVEVVEGSVVVKEDMAEGKGIRKPGVCIRVVEDAVEEDNIPAVDDDKIGPVESEELVEQDVLVVQDDVEVVEGDAAEAVEVDKVEVKVEEIAEDILEAKGMRKPGVCKPAFSLSSPPKMERQRRMGFICAKLFTFISWLLVFISINLFWLSAMSFGVSSFGLAITNLCWKVEEEDPVPFWIIVEGMSSSNVFNVDVALFVVEEVSLVV